MTNNLPRTDKGTFLKGVLYSPETMFKPGHVPANKGNKFPGTGNEKSFRKGNLPHNTLADGDIRTRTSNEGHTYSFIRIEKGKWEFLQKYRWINEVGPIEKGMVLRCKTTDTLNCDPANWELITKAENAQRNRSLSSEIKQCVICGNDFNAIRKDVKTCGDECRKVYNRQLTREWHKKHPRDKKEHTNFVTNKVRECIICGGAYFPTSNVQKVCSDSCRTIHNTLCRKQLRAKNRPETPELKSKHCSRCGQVFSTANSSRTICDKCKTPGPRHVTCLNCGKEFTSTGKGVQLLCSVECKRERKNKLRATYGYNRHPKEKPVKVAECIECGKSFESKNGNTFCTEKCRHTHKLKQQREWRKKQRASKPPKPKKEKAIKPVTIKAKPRKQAENKPDQPPVHRQLNKRTKKAEREAALSMPELNRNAPKHDGEIVKEMKIESPDLSTMEFRYYDKRLKQTFFFRTEEKYNNFLKKIQDA